MNPITTAQYDHAVRVLVADADPDTRSLFEELLTIAGCEVVAAVDGRDALVKAFSGTPTLVITEMRLPILDGYDLSVVLRHDAATQTVPILMVTSETRLAMLERARVIGVDAILNKPVTPEALLDEIRRLLEQTQRSRTVANARFFQTEPKRRSLVKAHLRMETTTPPTLPPELVCPECYRPLIYEVSHVGGVSRRHAEQWDRYACSGACGHFEYRQRTRKIRRLV